MTYDIIRAKYSKRGDDLKKLLLVMLLCVGSLVLFACGEDGIETESIIVSKEIIEGDYYFNVEYEIDDYVGTFTATIKVTQSVYNAHDVGDTYVFTRPKPEKSYRN